MTDWAHLAHLDRLKIQIIGLAWDYDDNDRSWADDSGREAPIDVRNPALDIRRVQDAKNVRGIKGHDSKESRTKSGRAISQKDKGVFI